MRLGLLAVKNVGRNRFRTIATVVAVAVAILAFVALRTVLTSWYSAVEHSAKDRIATRHKITFVMTLPLRYAQDIRQVPEVENATWMNWFGGKHPQRETDFFATIAVDGASFLDVYDEIEVQPEQKQAWLDNRRGALVGRVLAQRFGWKVGQTVTLRGTIYPGDWEFEVSAIYETSRKSVDEASFWFHWEYLNENLVGRTRDQVGWIAARVDDPSRSAQISKKIDAMFEERDVQTLTMSERSLNVSFMGMFTAILDVINIVSVVILGIMMLILGNTIAMGVRERTNEYGMLRAIGFRPRHIAGFVLGEALTVGVLGGGLGVLLSYPVINGGLGRALEEQAGQFFPYFQIAPSTAVEALALAAVLGLIGAALPAVRAARLNVVESIRRVG